MIIYFPFNKITNYEPNDVWWHQKEDETAGRLIRERQLLPLGIQHEDDLARKGLLNHIMEMKSEDDLGADWESRI